MIIKLLNIYSTSRLNIYLAFDIIRFCIHLHQLQSLLLYCIQSIGGSIIFGKLVIALKSICCDDIFINTCLSLFTITTSPVNHMDIPRPLFCMSPVNHTRMLRPFFPPRLLKTNSSTTTLESVPRWTLMPTLI